MKTFLSFSLTWLLLLFFITGCIQNYETLPPVPEYPAVAGDFDTSANIEFLPDANPELNDIVKENLLKNGYSNLLPELRFQFHDLSRTRVLQLLRVNERTYHCKDGDHIECQVIAVVRQPGEIWNGTLTYDEPRYFQAFSRKLWNPQTVAKSVLEKEVLRQAFANLFLIPEFRSALEPETKKTSGIATDPSATDDFWVISNREKADGNNYMAVHYAELAARSGNRTAEEYLAQGILYSDVFRPSKVFAKISRYAEGGSAAAQNKLALIYLSGKGVEVDNSKALQWFRKAADQNYPEAQYNLGSCYENGTGTEKDMKTAMQLYFSAAQNGYAKALQKIVSYAHAGNTIAQNKLGLMYLHGNGVDANKHTAVYWFERAAYTFNASPEAQYNLASCYENGIGVEKDVAIAKVLYQSAARGCYQPAVVKVKSLEQ